MKLKKPLIALASVALVAAISIGATMAFLTAKTDSVVNTFTVGNVEISLGETTGSNYKMIPGTTYAKDPLVSVLSDSEDCWLFVEVLEEYNTADNNGRYIDYAINDTDWELVSGTTNVYCYKGNSYTGTDGTTSYVLEGNEDFANGCVKINEENVNFNYVSKLTDETRPKLTFTAYAVQKEHVDDIATAWAICSR